MRVQLKEETQQRENLEQDNTRLASEVCAVSVLCSLVVGLQSMSAFVCL